MNERSLFSRNKKKSGPKKQSQWEPDVIGQTIVDSAKELYARATGGRSEQGELPPMEFDYSNPYGDDAPNIWGTADGQNDGIAGKILEEAIEGNGEEVDNSYPIVETAPDQDPISFIIDANSIHGSQDRIEIDSPRGYIVIELEGSVGHFVPGRSGRKPLDWNDRSEIFYNVSFDDGTAPIDGSLIADGQETVSSDEIHLPDGHAVVYVTSAPTAPSGMVVTIYS